MSVRSSGYSTAEDKLLCQVYMDISQDPITGVYQTADKFWCRIEEAYNKANIEGSEHRTARSLQSRWQIIEKAVRKLLGCVRQVEYMNPSGASDQDILDRAKMLLMQDTNYKKGFKFDHVWNIMKDFQKFQDDATTARQLYQKHTSNYVSSESDNQAPNSNEPESPGLSSFPINLNSENTGDSSSGRPIGVKKAKGKRKIQEQDSYLKEQNEKLLEMLQKSHEDRQVQMEMQRDKIQIEKQKLKIKEEREENKIMSMDLDQITDPTRRAYYAAKQARISAKWSQQSQPQPPSQPNMFSQYFSNIGGDGDDLPDY